MASQTEERHATEESASVVTAELPADGFALAETFRAVPDARFECEEVVETGEQTVMPLLWAYTDERVSLERAFADDPSVAAVSLIEAFDGKLLYRMEWATEAHFVFKVLTNAHATVLEASGGGSTWTLRILYPTRESLSDTHQFCQDHKLEWAVRSIRELDDEQLGQLELTAKQRETLVTAHELGYFEVPRGTDLDALAGELGISHQALSERIRRANKALIQAVLVPEPPLDEPGAIPSSLRNSEGSRQSDSPGQ